MASVSAPRTQWYEIQGKDPYKRDKKKETRLIIGG